MRVDYVRMYDDPDGESHFEDCGLDLEERDFAPPAAPAMVGTFEPSAGTLFFGAAPGWGGEIPHASPQRQVFCVLRGAIDVTVSDGECRRLSAGDVLFLDDTRGRGHSTHVVGADDLVIFGAVLADQEYSPGPSSREP
ncbi:MAG TPA: cupin domain-containing protein [Miltoncostaeaceae bacterium]|nr:cupin domain-containing protein [Miltoncostaeaceae bacterium]